MSKKEQLRDVLVDFGSEFYLKENGKVGFLNSTVDRFVDYICDEFGITVDNPKPEPKKRYFIVFYASLSKKGRMVFTTNGEYIQDDKALEFIRYEVEEEPTITNIIELNESDYKDWIS